MTERQRLVVHLGNMGQARPEETATKTRRYAERFPNVRFIGIDLLSRSRLLPQDGQRSNWQQVQARFKDGLESSVEDGSADVISAEMSVGYYLDGKTTAAKQKELGQLLDLCHRKLKPGGKLFIVTGTDAGDRLERAFNSSKFNRYRTNRVRATGQDRTMWMSRFERMKAVNIQFSAAKER
ncbi:hypothetical protein AUJ14_06310 [Candidatus Micrarchaeota archaeon CG1_02_55_22]|nr:MAG: hypothetical protein AUJ14_06310 [Candidatus Micrarchaeota archaeon CG1_02_55_22]